LYDQNNDHGYDDDDYDNEYRYDGNYDECADLCAVREDDKDSIEDSDLFNLSCYPRDLLFNYGYYYSH